MFLKLSIATFQDLGPKVNCAAAYKYDSPNTTCACASSENNIVSLESIQPASLESVKEYMLLTLAMNCRAQGNI